VRPCLVVARGPQDVSTESAHLRHRRETWRRHKNADLKTLLKADERGVEVLLKRGGTRLERSHGGIQKRRRKMPGGLLVLGTTVSPTAHRHPTDHAPFTTPITSIHQYLPQLFLSSSRDQVSRVSGELRPCSELVMMSVSGVEFALVLGVGKWRA